MVIARLAWLQLTECEQQACSRILREHPHYAEYLSADKPEGIGPDEWAFMRPAYWPDWVRSNHSEAYNHPTWHYITAAYVPPHSRLSASQLSAQQPNVVTQISACREKLRGGTPTEKAVYLCWLLHLVGDIHQPLHYASQLCEAFPQGDQGGIWPSSAGETPRRCVCTSPGIRCWETICPSRQCWRQSRICKSAKPRPSRRFATSVRQRRRPAIGAHEGFELARSHVYLNGDLRPCHVDQQMQESLIPRLADSYLRTQSQSRGDVRGCGRYPPGKEISSQPA